jgi:hypothetical protein
MRKSGLERESEKERERETKTEEKRKEGERWNCERRVNERHTQRDWERERGGMKLRKEREGHPRRSWDRVREEREREGGGERERERERGMDEIVRRKRVWIRGESMREEREREIERYVERERKREMKLLRSKRDDSMKAKKNGSIHLARYVVV